MAAILTQEGPDVKGTVGARAVQVGTAFMKEGPGVFPRLRDELAGVLDAKGYGAASQVVGKLKVL